MFPFLRDGDVVRVLPRSPAAIVPGDVACYAVSGALLLHRVVRGGEQFVIKGDALSFADIVAPADVLGTVVAVVRRGRVFRMDTRRARVRNRVIALLSPLISWGISVAIAIRQRLDRWRHA